MAVAEARAAWQRTANRCFVQEDAKRAPKLACCPSTSSSSKQVDAGPVNAADGQENPTLGFLPLNRNPSYSNLPPDSRWWLQLQSNYGYQRGLTNEQLNALEAEMETFRASLSSSASKHGGPHLQNKDEGALVANTVNSESTRTTVTCTKKDPEVRKHELKAVYTKNAQEPLKVEDLEESHKLIEMDPVGCLVMKQTNELCFDSESPWIGGEKTEPWWRKADRDELASFVAQRSLDYIENCDLPQPQTVHVRRDPYAHIGCYYSDDIFAPSVDWKPRIVDIPNPTVRSSGIACGPNPTVHSSGIACGKRWASVEGHSQFGTDKPISDIGPHKGTSDPSKAELLEALTHSQTRAREAEKAAKQANAEKEHIVKLFFKQASHLFAYKQWFQILQLENLYFQIRNSKNSPVSTLFPAVLPLPSQKTRKTSAKGKQAKKGRPRYDISKYAIVFAFGLGLVGAGLLLGWTIGWMLPAL